MKYLKLFIIAFIAHILIAHFANATLISSPTPLPSDYPTLAHSRMTAQSTAVFNVIKNFLVNAYKAAWLDSAHPAPAFFNALGSDCAQAHALFLAEAQILDTAIPGAVPSGEPCNVTGNSDGTCSVVGPQSSP